VQNATLNLKVSSTVDASANGYTLDVLSTTPTLAGFTYGANKTVANGIVSMGSISCYVDVVYSIKVHVTSHNISDDVIQSFKCTGDTINVDVKYVGGEVNVKIIGMVLDDKNVGMGNKQIDMTLGDKKLVVVSLHDGSFGYTFLAQK
jgi:hypothetical protein